MTTYLVRPGDNLTGIAERYGITADDLQRLNPFITDPNVIFPGWELRIPQGQDGETEALEPGSLQENIQRVTAYNWKLVEADIPYYIWRDDVLINTDGPPGYAVDFPAPDPSDIEAIFCAGVGNVDRRLLGLPVPKHNNWSGWDGGTVAWEHNYWTSSIWFDLDFAEEGDIAFQRWGGSAAAQGHWAYCTGGADDPVIQSYPNTWQGTIVEPGMNADHTLRESHNGDFYEVLIKAASWLSPK